MIQTDLHSFDGVPRFDLGLVSRKPTRTRQEVLSMLGLSELDSCRHVPIER